MKCFRCGKELGSADDHNADYIIADDTICEEAGTKIQKTAIICPECYKPTDYVIWGVHKK